MSDINITIGNEGDINVVLDGISTFQALTDTPSSYTGESGKLLQVKSTEDGIEFTDSPTVVDWGEIAGTLSDQTDLQAELNAKEEDLTFSTGLTRTGDTITVNNSELSITASQVSDFDTEVSNNTSVTANTAKVTYPSADSTKVGFISVTQAVDLDTMESDIATNNSKVTNATHTGDITGDTTLIIGADKVLDSHINWGTGATQVNTADIPELTNLYYTEVRVSANTDVAANTVHKTSNGSDHTYIDQSVISGATPTFTGTNFSNISATALPDANDDSITKGVSTYDNTDFNVTTGVVTIEDSGISHNSLTNTHNLSSDIDHTTITNIGSNTHTQIDSHISNTSNPHSVDATDVSLGNVTNVATDDTTYNATSWNANSDSATKNAIRDKIETMDTAIGLNTAKDTNVSTDLSLGTITSTTMDVNSSDGSNATLIAADTDDAGLLTATKFDEIVANNAKVTNVTTNLSAGTRTSTTIDVNSSDGTNATLVEADTTNAGILGSDKWDEIVANTAVKHTQGTDTTLGTMTQDIDMNSSYQVVGLQAPAATGEAIRQTTNVTETNLNTLTGGGDTTLHDHDGISENTSARHTQNTDTALGSGAVAADHGTGTTDQIINVSYGTSATPPTASTTTEGSLYVQYTA